MLYVVLALSGLVTGAAVGRDADALWGMLIGLLTAHVVRQGGRIRKLERHPNLEGASGAVAEAASTRTEPTVEIEARGEPAPFPDAEPVEPAPPRTETPPAPAARELESDETDPGWRAIAQASERGDERPATASGKAPTLPDELPLANRAARAVWRFFTGGNPMVRVGAVVLFVAVALLLQYLADRVTVPVQWRLAGIGAGGLAMVAAGVVLRLRRPGFALPFQGAGIGVVYLTTFAALRLYDLLPAGVALTLLLGLVALTVVLALWQDAVVLAALAAAGGFLAPVLTSTGQGSHVELFSFYLVLNLGIAAIAWFRAWRWLNVLGFVFTFGIASLWGERYYQPEYFATTEPFLVVHVALYLTIAILFAVRQPPRLKGLVDATLVFGTPLVGFTLQALLLEDSEYGLAISAAVLGTVYLLLRGALLARDRQHFALLAQCFGALGVGFLTLAVPLAFDARVTSATWTLEGAAVAWVGIRQAAAWRRGFGYALMGVGSIAFLAGGDLTRDTLAFLNAEFLGVAIIAGSFGFIADRARAAGLEARVPGLPGALFTYAAVWWLVGGLVELEGQLTGKSLMFATLAYFAATLVPAGEYARWRSWLLVRRWMLFGALTFAVFALLWRAPDTGPLLRGANTLAAAGGFGLLVALGWRLRGWGLPPSAGWADALGIIATAGWLISGLMEIDAALRGPDELHAGLVFASASLVAVYFLARPLNWPLWHRATDALVAVPVLALAAGVDRGIGPWVTWGEWAWTACFASITLLLGLRERLDPDDEGLTPLHAAGFWSLMAVLAWAAHDAFESSFGAGHVLTGTALAAVPALLAALALWPLLDRSWPLSTRSAAYRGPWLAPVALWLTGWLLVSNLNPPGSHAPLRYLPLLNPQDLTAVGVLVLLGDWWARQFEAAPPGLRRAGAVVLGSLGFLWLNAALLRSLHLLLPIPWDLDVMMDSFTVQAAITLLWVVTALALMVYASRTRRRWLWTTGAGLMAAVVLKLFVVDTAGSGTLAQIAAFFGVAVGLFLAGYLVPRPPPRVSSE